MNRSVVMRQMLLRTYGVVICSNRQMNPLSSQSVRTLSLNLSQFVKLTEKSSRRRIKLPLISNMQMPQSLFSEPVLILRSIHLSKHLDKKRKIERKLQTSSVDEDNEDDEEGAISDDDDFDSQGDMFEDDDREFNKNYKDISALVKSLRLDSITGVGLNISRNKIDDYFLASKLRLNGDRVLKKSKKMEPGDYVDLISEKSDAEHSIKVKRVRLLSVASQKSRKEKLKVRLRTWRQNTTIAVED